MKRKVFSILILWMLIVLVINPTFAHSGRTDSSGGHRDNKNKSGLGGYHYHCGGYPPHLHTNGACPYKGGSSSSYSSSGSNSTTYNTPQKIYATRVDIPDRPTNIKIGESINLTASVYPSNSEDNSVTWDSSDSTIAIIDSAGNLKAVGVGTVIISAKTSRGTKSEFSLTVNEIEAEDIKIVLDSNEILLGDSDYLKCEFLPENTTHKSIKWISSDNSLNNQC